MYCRHAQFLIAKYMKTDTEGKKSLLNERNETGSSCFLKIFLFFISSKMNHMFYIAFSITENKNKTGEGAVFGIPINQCVDPSRKRSTTDIPAEEALSPTSKSSRSDSRTSFGSIFDSPMKDKSMERVRLLHV